MTIVIELLWVSILVLFFAGCVVYAIRPHGGMELLKRAAVLLVVLLIGPSFLRSAMAAIPSWVLVLLGGAVSIAAYAYLMHHNGSASHRKSSGTSHAERHPKLPHHEDDPE